MRVAMTVAKAEQKLRKAGCTISHPSSPRKCACRQAPVSYIVYSAKVKRLGFGVMLFSGCGRCLVNFAA